MTPDDTNLQNWLDGAGFTGLAIGLVFGLVVGTWIVVKIWRFAVREMRESVRKDGLPPPCPTCGALTPADHHPECSALT